MMVRLKWGEDKKWKNGKKTYSSRHAVTWRFRPIKTFEYFF